MKYLKIKNLLISLIIINLLIIIALVALKNCMNPITNFFQEEIITIECMEKRFITECIETCFNDIYNYMRQDDSKIFYGTYDVCIGEKMISLMTIFYNDYIINEQYIRQYLENVNWQEIIAKNNKNMTAIISHIRQEYIISIKDHENYNTYQLLQNTNIEEIKGICFNILKTYAESLTIDQKILDNFIVSIIKNVDWNLYIRTIECQNNDFSTIKAEFQLIVEAISYSKIDLEKIFNALKSYF